MKIKFKYQTGDTFSLYSTKVVLTVCYTISIYFLNIMTKLLQTMAMIHKWTHL